jgi:hypothetical protein
MPLAARIRDIMERNRVATELGNCYARALAQGFDLPFQSQSDLHNTYSNRDANRIEGGAYNR